MRKFILLSIALALMACASQKAMAGPPQTICNAANTDCATITGSKLDVNASVSASISGFTPSASGSRMTPLTVSTSDVSGTLPTGAAVIVSNPGATLMYCNVLGVAATASDQPIAAGGGWYEFTIPSGVTTLHCISTGSGTTANGLGGSGIATGAGAGGSGGSGSNAAASATGSSVPSSGSYNAVSVGGTLTGQTGTSGGNANDNIAQVGGSAVATGHGTASGALRVELPTDGTGVVTAAQATAANLKAQVSVASGGIASGGVASGAVASGAYASGSIGSGAIASGAVASGAVASGAYASGSISDGADVTQGAKADSVCGTATGTCTITALIKYLNSQVAAMPNTGGCGSIIPISQTSSTDLHTSVGKSYICSIVLVVPDAEVVSLVEGTGTVCATGIAALIGNTTAANGMSFAANGGFSAVSPSPMMQTQTTNDHWCLLQSGSGRIAGFISYNDH